MITFTNNGTNTSILDYHARQFITATKLTDYTQIRAINELCKDLKKERIWDKLRIIYPFVYNSAFTASVLYNLKDTSYAKLVEIGSTGSAPTYSNTGIKFNGDGVSAINLSINFYSLNATFSSSGWTYAPPMSMAVYNRFNSISAPSGYNGENASKAGSSTTPLAYLGFQFGTNSVGFDMLKWHYPTTPLPGASYSKYFTQSDTSGFWIHSAINSNGGSASKFTPYNYLMSKNGVGVGLFIESHGPTFGSANVNGGFGVPAIRLGQRIGDQSGLVGSTNPSRDELCWYSLGWMDGDGSVVPWNGPDPISPTQHMSFYQIVQKFQTKLGRQV